VITAPVWNENVNNRIAYATWFIRENPAVYQGFRTLANNLRERDPDRPFGASLILETLRYHTTIKNEGDVYCLNNNLKSLMARLYLLEYPDAKLEVRGCWLDHLSPSERAQIFDAFKAMHGLEGQGEAA
jgi:hypothetical protein